MARAAVERQYELIGLGEGFAQAGLGSSEYFSSALGTLQCVDHLKFMDLNYSCVDEPKEHFPGDMHLFVVEKNFERYFMRLDDSLVKYEILLEKSFKVEGIVLHLLEHKIVHSRFVGIYKYEENLGLLDQFIKTGDPDEYSLYRLMRDLAQLLATVMADRDPKNPFLNINLLPTNVMLMASRASPLKLIRVIPFSPREILKLSTPETPLQTAFVDKRSYHVFLLGKVFYFLCFKSFPVRTDTELLNFLADYREADIEPGEVVIDRRVIYLIRRMLNSSPVDRPPLSEVLETLDQVRSEGFFFLNFVSEFLAELFQKMKSEVQVELFRVSAQKNDIFLAPSEESNLQAVSGEALRREEQKLRGQKDLVRTLLNVKIREEVNERDKFGMLKDMVLEDVVDDSLRQTLNSRRKKLANIKGEDLRDRLETLGDFAGHMAVFEKFEALSPQQRELDKMLRQEYIALMKKQLVLGNYRLLLHSGAAEAHAGEGEGFPLQYVFFLGFTVVIVAVFAASLYLRTSQVLTWKKGAFHTYLISEHLS